MNGLHNDQNVTDDIQNINFYPRLIEIENILDEIKNSNHDLKTENTKLRSELDDAWYNIRYLEKDLNLLQQYNRRENIEISNIPDTIENHELDDVVIGILRRIGVDNLESWEIAACHRLKKRKNDQFGNIIIRFINRKRAIQCLKYKKYLKDYICEYPKIYILENLCPRFCSIFED